MFQTMLPWDGELNFANCLLILVLERPPELFYRFFINLNIIYMFLTKNLLFYYVRSQNVKNICGKECKKEKYCQPHRRLNFVKMLKESVLKRNRNQNKTIKIFEMELVRHCQHSICMHNWCFNVLKKKLQWEFSKNEYQTVFL